MPKPVAIVPPAERVALTFEQAGEMLGVSQRTIWRLVRAGELRTLLVRSSRRISRVEVERYAIAQEAAEQTPPRRMRAS